MKLITYNLNNVDSLGVLVNDSTAINVNFLSKNKLPNNMHDFVLDFEDNYLLLKETLKVEKDFQLINLEDINVMAPILKPTSFRDAYAFRQHVEAGRKNRGLKMIPEYDKFPVFYFSNHQSIIGPGEVVVKNKHMDKLDFEFEVAVLISKCGINIKSKDAHEYIAGLMILNDWSARGMQLEEMKLNLGPAKGKDFATSIGPYLVTLDELEDSINYNDNGITFDLKMKGSVNGKLVSSDNVKNMTWSFSQIIERASYGVELYPGDIIGSGTCATGCFLELNSSNKSDTWLKAGDKVSLEIDKLGTLNNTIILNK